MHLPVTRESAMPVESALPVRAGRPTWGRRRLLAATALLPAALALLVTSGGGWTAAATPVWLVLLAVAAAVSALTLASYVPDRGQAWQDTLGCSPCAALSGGTVLAAAFLLSTAPHQVATALPAVAIVLFGLVQRSGQSTCST